MEELDHITPAQIRVLTRKLVREGPSILPTDKRNRNGFTAFLFCFYRHFNQLNIEEKQAYVGGRYRPIPIVPTAPDLKIPDDVDEDDEYALVAFFMQQTQAVALTSQEKATIHIIILPTAIAKHVVCGVVIMLLQRPNLKRLLLI